MSKVKEMRRENISVASEIDRVEGLRSRCQDTLDRAEYRWRRLDLSDQDRHTLEDEITVIKEKINKFDQELQELRGENRRNMMVSVALLAVCAFFYYSFIS